jgi:hypothetical protein
MELVHEFTLRATRTDMYQVGGVPAGGRVVATVGEGTVKGARLTGTLIGPGADWALLGPDGYAQIDVRLQIRTVDGADIYLSYNGSLELNEVASTALFGGGETRFGDNYWFTHVRLEAGAEQYAWVNRAMFVAQGRAVPNGIEYEVYRLA